MKNHLWNIRILFWFLKRDGQSFVAQADRKLPWFSFEGKGIIFLDPRSFTPFFFTWTAVHASAWLGHCRTGSEAKRSCLGNKASHEVLNFVPHSCSGIASLFLKAQHFPFTPHASIYRQQPNTYHAFYGTAFQGQPNPLYCLEFSVYLFI